MTAYQRIFFGSGPIFKLNLPLSRTIPIQWTLYNYKLKRGENSCIPCPYTALVDLRSSPNIISYPNLEPSIATNQNTYEGQPFDRLRSFDASQILYHRNPNLPVGSQ